MESSVVHWFEEDDGGHKCGYCKNPKGFRTAGLWSYKLTTKHYQIMIDRGWRRSGQYCYRPLYRLSCCQLYTIRAPAKEFKLTSSMRRTAQKVNNYLVFNQKPAKVGEIKYRRVVPSIEISPANGVWRVDTMLGQLNSELERILTVSNSEWVNIPNQLEVLLVKSWPPSEYFKATYREEHLIYVAYQCSIHKDPPSKVDMKQFARFLVEGPLEDQTSAQSGLDFGAYHMQYRINNRLVAVSVIDILPNCVSSVYTFYDPVFGFLNPGTYTALYEIALVRVLNSGKFFKGLEDLTFYYMGYYIHNCQKMKYKGLFGPAYLLCPETMQWTRYEDAVKIIERVDNKFTRLVEKNEATDEDGNNAASSVLKRKSPKNRRDSTSQPTPNVARLLGSTLSRELKFV